MRKFAGILLGLALVVVPVYAQEGLIISNVIESTVDITAPSYSMNSYNLALLENCYVSLLIENGTAVGINVYHNTTQTLEQHGMDSVYRYIKSFDSFKVMEEYTAYQNNVFDDALMTYLKENWGTHYIYEVVDYEF